MSQPLLTIVPLPLEKTFQTNNSMINGLRQSGTYIPNGSYTLSCSSRSNINYEAYNAFNNDKKYWESNYKGNPSYNPLNTSYPDYRQQAYTGRNPSVYRGGGKKENTFITKVGLGVNKNDIKGEWLQIRIPYKVFLKSYSIETPPSSSSTTFPKEFLVVGSNDGETWESLNTQNVNSRPNETKKAFDLVYPKNFSYFRLIITKLHGPLDRVQISNWSLFGNTMLISNKDNAQESFVSLGRCLDCKDNSNQSIIGSFTPYAEGFDSYTYTSELRQKHPLPENQEERNKYIKAVEEKQLNPLQKKAGKYEEDVKNITIKHENISNTLNSITNANQNGLLDELKKTPEYKNSTIMTNIDSVEDVRLKDIETMINTNNEIYVLGGIAAATLVIFSGMLWMK